MAGFAKIFDGQLRNHQSGSTALKERAHAAGWTVLRPGESVRLDDVSHSVVISGVPWSKPDLDVLDELAARDTGDTRV